MSPEQIGGAENTDGRSDLYSLGCVLYESLSGALPFQASNPLALIGKHLTETPAPLREQSSDVPASLESLVMRLLAKEPDERHSSAAELAPLLRGEAAFTATTNGVPALVANAPPAPATSSEIERLLKDATDKLNQASAAGPAALRRLDEARALIDRAAEIDPNHPRVLSALGRWYNASGHRRGTGDSMVAEGRQYLMRALAGDDRDPEVHQVIGKMSLYYDDDFQTAEQHARRAVELAPNDPEGLRFLAVIEKILDHVDASIDAAQRAARIAPHLAAVWYGLGDALLSAGRNAEASIALEKAIGLQSGYVPALERLELAQLRLGDVDFAAELRAARLRAAGVHDRADALERSALANGAADARRADLEVELHESLDRAKTVDPFAEYFSSRSLGDRVVHLYTQLDDWQSALEWVERGFRARPGRLRRALTDQLFDRRGFNTLPRYARMLRLAGLEALL
jgi:tetratricopeptide (TPR) repeat protein